MNQNNQDLTPDLDNEERKNLGLVYYKPIAKELVDYLQTTGNRAEEKNDSKGFPGCAVPAQIPPPDFGKYESI